MARGGRMSDNKMMAKPKLQNNLLDNLHNRKSFKSELLKYKLPIHFGGMSDPFSNPTTVKTSLAFLDILNKFNYPVILSTKNFVFNVGMCI